MKNLLVCGLLFLACTGTAQSADGKGTTLKRPAKELKRSMWPKKYEENVGYDQKTKYKDGILAFSIQEMDYQDEKGNDRRFRRAYDINTFMYDEQMMKLTPEQLNQAPETNTIIAKKRKMVFSPNHSYVYHGKVEVFDDEVLQSTLYFDKGFLYKIHINHYYFSNGQLQFVREITRDEVGEPFRNTGVLEAYYPDGRPFEDPITEDGKAIIILNDEGEREDTCECMDQDIMPWGEGYLYAFLGKFYYYLEAIYQQNDLECCWE